MIQSLSGIGHCFDNARMESFFAAQERRSIRLRRTSCREQVKTIIFRYVFIYYNRVRIYTRNPLGLPPVKYRGGRRRKRQPDPMPPPVFLRSATLHFGKLRCITMLFRFWVFPDCTFLDISTLFEKEIPLPYTLPEKISIASEQLEEVRCLPIALPCARRSRVSIAIRFGLLLSSAAALLILFWCSLII